MTNLGAPKFQHIIIPLPPLMEDCFLYSAIMYIPGVVMGRDWFNDDISHCSSSSCSSPSCSCSY